MARSARSGTRDSARSRRRRKTRLARARASRPERCRSGQRSSRRGEARLAPRSGSRASPSTSREPPAMRRHAGEVPLRRRRSAAGAGAIGARHDRRCHPRRHADGGRQSARVCRRCRRVPQPCGGGGSSLRPGRRWTLTPQARLAPARARATALSAAAASAGDASFRARVQAGRVPRGGRAPSREASNSGSSRRRARDRRHLGAEPAAARAAPCAPGARRRHERLSAHRWAEGGSQTDGEFGSDRQRRGQSPSGAEVAVELDTWGLPRSVEGSGATPLPRW